MSEHKPRVSTDEMKARIREELEQEQELDLLKEMIQEHKEELEEFKQMKPWFRAGRWLAGAIVAGAIGWFFRGGFTKLTKAQPCVTAPAKAGQR